MATTTNFNWSTPDDTALVKDGAAAIRTLGSSIDTSLVDLKGGTTGQVLAKASGTDMDFTWATDASGIPATIFDAAGDIIAASAADTAARLAVGANGTVLTADSGEATGLKWTSASAAKNFTLVNTGGTALSGTTVTISGISAADELLILIVGASTTGGGTGLIRINGDTTSANYAIAGGFIDGKATYNANFVGDISELGTGGYFRVLKFSSDAASIGSVAMHLTGCNSAGAKIMNASSSASFASSSTQYAINTGGVYLGTSTVSSIDLVSNTGGYTWDAGTIYVYKSA